MPAEATLFRRVRVVDRGSPHHGQTVNLLLRDGRIALDPAQLPTDYTTVALEGLCVSPGFVDLGAGVGEPGYEQRETVESLLDAAAVGGYTHVIAQASSEPAVDTQSAVRALVGRAAGHAVGFGVIGALSKGHAGAELAEAGDMAAAGVRFVGDGLAPVDDPKLLQLGIAYAAPLGLAVVATPGQRRMSGAGQMHEGLVSTRLGLPGIPALAEELGLARDLALLGYRGGRLHVQAVSLGSAVAMLERAGETQAGLTYAVPVLNLLLTDEALLGFEVEHKVDPPLRPAPDREALRAAVRRGAPDAIISNHRPLEIERKAVEFPYADPGAATIEQAFALATTALDDPELVADYLGRRNRGLAGLAPVVIEEGARAELTFFLPDHRYAAPTTCTASLGSNPPAAGVELRGLVYAVAVESRLLVSAFARGMLDAK